MPKTDVGLIAYAVAEVAKLWKQWLISADRRKMSKCIEAGEKYIQTDRRTNLTSDKKEKLKKHYCKRFFKYNN